MNQEEVQKVSFIIITPSLQSSKCANALFYNGHQFLINRILNILCHKTQYFNTVNTI